MGKYNVIPFHLGLEKPNNMLLLYDGMPEQKNFCIHTHTNYEILILLEGDAEMVVEEKHFLLRQNDLVVIPKGREHYLRLVGNAPYKRIIIYFSLEKLRALGLWRFAEEIEKCEPYTVNISDTSFLFTMSDVSHTAVTKLDEDMHHTIFCERILSLYLSLVSRSEKKIDGPSDALVDRAIEYINTHLSDDISIESVAASIHISGSHLCKVFKNKIGIAPMKYVNKQRIFLAKKLIYDNVPLGEVCTACGFENYPTFFRAFKAETGRSPSDFLHET